jgi:hypothetical protein
MTPNEIVIALTRALDESGVAYMLVGSFSSNAYGVPRSTKDADVVVETDRDLVAALGGKLGPEFRFEPQMSFETITSTTKNVIYHKASAFKIEVFHLSPDAHDRERFSRRRRGNLDGVPIWLPAPEDVVITKLRWSRSAGRQKDIDDVTDVLAVQVGQLDLAYIRKWCDLHGTREVFERLLTEAQDV